MRAILLDEWSKGEIELMANALEIQLNAMIPRDYPTIVRHMLSTVNRGNVLGLLEYDKRLWCSTNSGVFVYNEKTDVFERVGGV